MTGCHGSLFLPALSNGACDFITGSFDVVGCVSIFSTRVDFDWMEPQTAELAPALW